MGRRGGLHAAQAVVAAGAAVLLWWPTPASASSVHVSVNGKRLQLTSDEATVADALAAAGIELRVGFMRTVATGEAVPDRVRQPKIHVGTRRATLHRRVGNGDRIWVENGADFVEPVVERTQTVPAAGLPDVETKLWQAGTDGVVKRLVGAYSGQQAGPEQVVTPVVPATPVDAPKVLLSFDDGPDPRFTPTVLEILKAKNVKAVFCVVGSPARSHPDLVRRIHAEGHTLCNHSEHHDMRMPVKPQAYITKEIEGVSNLIRDLTGTAPRFYRGPGGSLSPFIITEVHRLGMRVLAWDVDPGDYRKPGAETIQDRIVVNMRNGGVALMHDGGGDRSQTVAQLPGLIDRLRAQGYEFAVP